MRTAGTSSADRRSRQSWAPRGYRLMAAGFALDVAACYIMGPSVKARLPLSATRGTKFMRTALWIGVAELHGDTVVGADEHPSDPNAILDPDHGSPQCDFAMSDRYLCFYGQQLI